MSNLLGRIASILTPAGQQRTPPDPDDHTSVAGNNLGGSDHGNTSFHDHNEDDGTTFNTPPSYRRIARSIVIPTFDDPPKMGVQQMFKDGVICRR